MFQGSSPVVLLTYHLRDMKHQAAEEEHPEAPPDDVPQRESEATLRVLFTYFPM